MNHKVRIMSYRIYLDSAVQHFMIPSCASRVTWLRIVSCWDSRVSRIRSQMSCTCHIGSGEVGNVGKSSRITCGPSCHCAYCAFHSAWSLTNIICRFKSLVSDLWMQFTSSCRLSTTFWHHFKIQIQIDWYRPYDILWNYYAVVWSWKLGLKAPRRG